MRRGRDVSAEEPIKCHLDKLIDGVRLVGKHDDDVTDLALSQWMTTRLASGSKDGTVCIKYPSCSFCTCPGNFGQNVTFKIVFDCH